MQEEAKGNEGRPGLGSVPPPPRKKAGTRIEIQVMPLEDDDSDPRNRRYSESLLQDDLDAKIRKRRAMFKKAQSGDNYAP